MAIEKVLYGIARAMKEAGEGGIGTSELLPCPRLKDCCLRPRACSTQCFLPCLKRTLE